jgi:hypothetical protein
VPAKAIEQQQLPQHTSFLLFYLVHKPKGIAIMSSNEEDTITRSGRRKLETYFFFFFSRQFIFSGLRVCE